MYTLFISKTAWGCTELELFTRLAEYLTRLGRPACVKRAEAFPLGTWSRRIIPDGCGFLQEDATGNFWLMDCQDSDGADATLTAAARHRGCRDILKQQYRPSALQASVARKVRPWTYTATNPGTLQWALPVLRGIARTQPGLLFRGSLGYAARRSILERLGRRGILTAEPGKIPFKDYCAELSAHRLTLSLPGWGNLCHREIEAFGIGTPVLMPRLINHLHHDLVPNYHYLSVDVEVGSTPVDHIAQEIERRYHEIADDSDLLRRVATQAMAWYDENAALPGCLRLTAELLGITGMAADK